MRVLRQCSDRVQRIADDRVYVSYTTDRVQRIADDRVYVSYTMDLHGPVH
jgi:hypothetical protein